MYKIGQQILLRQGLSLIKCVIVDIDATFLTLRMEYKKNEGMDIKVNINSKDIVNVNGLNVTGFDFNNNGITKA